MSWIAKPFVLAYDIKDKKRLRRVHKLLKSWGLPIQYSVFAVDLTEQSADHLFRAVEKLVDPDLDDVRLYQAGRCVWYGRGPASEGIILTGSPSAEMF